MSLQLAFGFVLRMKISFTDIYFSLLSIKAMNQGAALVHIYMDGSVLVAHGGTEMGQGELNFVA